MLPLPRGKVAILHGEFRQRRRLAKTKRAIKGAEFIQKNLTQAAVVEQVVKRQYQKMPRGADPHEFDAQKWAVHQINWGFDLLIHHPVSMTIIADVDDCHWRHWGRSVNDL